VGFTQFPDVCPVTLANQEAVRAELGVRQRPDHQPNIIFLAVDPERDKPVLQDYLSHFHTDYVGVTGEPQQIDKLVAGLDAFYRLEKTHPNDHRYQVKHSAAVSIINPRAEIVAKISPPFHPHRTADYLFKVIKGVSHDD
jgi:protein SCO1/2